MKQLNHCFIQVSSFHQSRFSLLEVLWFVVLVSANKSLYFLNLLCCFFSSEHPLRSRSKHYFIIKINRRISSLLSISTENKNKKKVFLLSIPILLITVSNLIQVLLLLLSLLKVILLASNQRQVLCKKHWGKPQQNCFHGVQSDLHNCCLVRKTRQGYSKAAKQGSLEVLVFKLVTPSIQPAEVVCHSMAGVFYQSEFVQNSQLNARLLYYSVFFLL